MERKKQNPIIAWIVKSKILGILFFVIIGAFAAYKIGQALIDNPSLFLQQAVNGLQLGFVYALIALGYTMIYGVVQLINFAHGDIFMVGAFSSFYAISRFNLHLWFQNLFPSISVMLSQIIGTVTVVLASMVICALLAFTIERIAYKPLRQAPRISALITAIGISFFLEYFGALNFVFTPNYITYKRPFEVKSWFIGPSGFGSVEAGIAPPDNSIIFSNIFLIIVLASILLLLVLQYIVKRTKIGKAMRAVAYDKPTARLMGINSNAIIIHHIRAGCSIGRRGRCIVRYCLPASVLLNGHHSRLESICGSRIRRHRQHPWRVHWRLDHGTGGNAQRRIHINPHA